MPSEGFGDTIRCGACQHRNRKKASADDTQGEEKECELTGDRTQRFGSVGGGFDLGDAMRIKRRRCCEDNELSNDVGINHADGGINRHALELGVAAAAKRL